MPYLIRMRFGFLVLWTFVAAAPLVFGQGPENLFRWRQCLSQPDEWYGSDEAKRIAENVVFYQQPNGGWGKNIDMARRLSEEDRRRIEAERGDVETNIDNGATFTQIRFLARVVHQTGEERFIDSIERGLRYLLEAQYENGGWPQFYPVKRGYYECITFNDGAMIGVMRVLRDVAEATPPFEFVDSELRREAQTAIERGLQVILDCQVEVDGRLTAWCAQHDPEDLSPRKARSYELPSLSGQESVGVVQYLMELDNPSPAVRQAVESAIEWFEQAKIEGLEVKWIRGPEVPGGRDRIVVSNPDAEPLWARFYEIGTNKPMFVGRDGIPREHLADIEQERRLRYSYLGNYAEKLLERDYPDWKEKWGE